MQLCCCCTGFGGASADQAQRHRPMEFTYHQIFDIFTYTTYRNVNVRIHIYQ